MNPDHQRSIPRVSVIVCTYNVCNYICKCLDSVFQQTLPSNQFEVVIVDDASEDNTVDAINEYAKKRNNIKIVQNKENIGPGPSRNKAIEVARGEYLYFLDGDDYIDPITLEVMLMSAYDNQSDLVVSGFIRIDEEGNIISKRNLPQTILKNKLTIMKHVLSLDENQMIGNRLIKKSIFLNNDLHFPKGFHEDAAIIYKVFFYSDNITIVPDYFYYWVQRKKSITATITKEHIDGWVSGLKSRVPFLAEKAGNGFLKKVNYDLKKGIYKAAYSMYTRITNYEGFSVSARANLLLYMFDSICSIPEGFESIISTTSGDESLLELFRTLRNAKINNCTSEEMISLIERNLEIQADLKDEPSLSDVESRDNEEKTYFERLSFFVNSIRNYQGDPWSKSKYISKRIFQIIKKEKERYIPRNATPENATPENTTPENTISEIVLFVCDADYHVRNAALIVRMLRKKGYDSGIINRAGYLSGGKRQLEEQELIELRDIKIYDYYERIYESVDLHRVKAAVFFNDWSDNNHTVRFLRKQGIVTFGIVEGVNDFLKLSEGFSSKISPYRTCEYVIVPGEFDTQFFFDRPGQYFVGGLPRIHQLYTESPMFPEKPLAVINVNFTYAVLTQYRELFLRTAIDGCKKANIDYVLTQHPMDNGDLSGLNVSTKNMYDTIREGTIFISRFSGAIIEALALGKPCVYHNPHEEQVVKFQDPLGAYSISFDSDSLAKAISIELEKVKNQPVHEYAKKFMDLHVNMCDEVDPNERISEVIIAKIKGPDKF